jgi:flagellar hook-associated protein 3 FlgL
MDLAFYTNFSANLTAQESQLNNLQEQVSTGVSVSSPAQGPAAYETATLGNDQISALASDTTAQTNIQDQLGIVNDTYSSVTSLFDNVQSVLEQSLNGTTSTANMQSLAAQVTAASTQLLGLANTTGAGGQYIFGGSRGSVQPFQTNPDGSVAYMGDGAQSQASIAPGVLASSLANGEVFMTGLSGNGFASVRASASNTGDATLISQGTSNPAAASSFQSGSSPVTISFAQGSSGLTYTETQGGTTVGTGNVTAGMSLQVAGLDYQLNGTPAAGDSFTISPSRPQSAFSLLQNIASTLSAASSDPAQAAQTNQQLNEDLSSLAQYQQAVVTASAQNGVTLQAVSNASAANTAQSTALQGAVQNAIGVNMPSAITQLDETLTSVQAAMKAFSDVQNLSLFKYL